MTEREFFKAMESGSLLSSEVLPKLATQMSKVAREGGALSAAQKTVNAEQQRFYTQLALAKRQFFEGGFGKAMAEIFSQMSSTLQSTNFASMGALIGGSLRGIADALNVLTLPLRGVINLFGALFGESGSKWLGYAAGIALVSVKVLALAKAVSFLAVAARALGATPVGLAISAVALGSLVALDKFVIQPSMQNPVDKMAQQAYSSKTNTQVNVVVKPDGNQFSRAVRADIMGYEYERNADTVAGIYA